MRKLLPTVALTVAILTSTAALAQRPYGGCEPECEMFSAYAMGQLCPNIIVNRETETEMNSISIDPRSKKMAEYYKRQSLLGLLKQLNNQNPADAPACHLDCTRKSNGDIDGGDNGVCASLKSW
jgi:hypothetical protein